MCSTCGVWTNIPKKKNNQKSLKQVNELPVDPGTQTHALFNHTATIYFTAHMMVEKLAEQQIQTKPIIIMNLRQRTSIIEFMLSLGQYIMFANSARNTVSLTI